VAPHGGSHAWTLAARGLATSALLADAVGIVLAMSFSTRRARALFDPFAVAALVIALAGTTAALRADQESATALNVLARRAVELLAPHPMPFAPASLRAFVALLAPLLACATLARRGAFPALAAAVALALLARGSAEVPLAAVALLVAGLTLALVGNDPAAVWAALGDAPRDGSSR
ncbi:MAG TPA: hypothetical protein VHB21_07580, partial [Minicystis sp.]|nr:hypothetical protein [Minicystis sp.]